MVQLLDIVSKSFNKFAFFENPGILGLVNYTVCRLVYPVVTTWKCILEFGKITHLSINWHPLVTNSVTANFVEAVFYEELREKISLG